MEPAKSDGVDQQGARGGGSGLLKSLRAPTAALVLGTAALGAHPAQAHTFPPSGGGLPPIPSMGASGDEQLGTGRNLSPRDQQALQLLVNNLSSVLDEVKGEIAPETEEAFLAKLRSVNSFVRQSLALDPTLSIKGLPETGEALIFKLKEAGFSQESTLKVIELCYGARIAAAASQWAKTDQMLREENKEFSDISFRELYQILVAFSTAIDIRPELNMTREEFSWALGTSAAALALTVPAELEPVDRQEEQAAIRSRDAREGFAGEVSAILEKIAMFEEEFRRSGRIPPGGRIELPTSQGGMWTRSAQEVIDLWPDGLPKRPLAPR